MNVGSADAPVGSLAAARDAVRGIRFANGGQIPEQGVEVVVADGIHSLREALALEAADSGDEGRPVVWRAATRGKAVLSGFLPGHAQATGNQNADSQSRVHAQKTAAYTLTQKMAGEFQKETGNNYNLEATPAEGTSYRLAKLDKENHTGIICSNDNEFYTVSTTSVAPVTNMSIDIGRETAHYLTGSIDLKQFSITVDGVEVFNGNKTGIDQIKKDDYTVVGSPVISDDGIASGFSRTNYVSTNVIDRLDTSKSWQVNGSFILNSIPVDATAIFSFGGENDWATRFTNFLSVQGGTGKIGMVITTDGTSNAINTSSDAVLNINTIYYFKWGWDKSNYYLELSFDNKTFTRVLDILNVNSAYKRSNLNRIGHIGQPWGDQNAFTGSIDLNSFKIYVDENLVYQPTLRIPYNQSKTGSKIVNSIYRDRVQDMYEQFGWANYYTLSDTDFTVPMGEIYGMKVDKADLVEINPMITSYVNGASGYNIWANGYCEQWGPLIVASAENTVTFAKTFTTIPIVILTRATGRTASSYDFELYPRSVDTTKFVYGMNTSNVTSAFWKASGYLASGQY